MPASRATGSWNLSFASVLMVLWFALGPAEAADWRVDHVATPGRVTAVEYAGGDVRIAVGGSWSRLTPETAKLEPASPPDKSTLPSGALPDSRVAFSKGDVARAWLADPTTRYRHGILGDMIEGGGLIIEGKDGHRKILHLGDDAVFEDLEPRIVRLGGSDKILLVKSYLERGSALAIIDPVSATIVAETPPIGHPQAWINPAGVADFDGDGATDIAVVRQPHVVGKLELWSWRDGQLHKTAEVADVANHFIGSHVLGMSAVADFDGDGRPDLAVPSLDRRSLRLIAFAPQPRDIARVKLDAPIVTNIATIHFRGRVALVAGLQNGQLVLMHD
jgi:hypothetical protein